MPEIPAGLYKTDCGEWIVYSPNIFDSSKTCLQIRNIVSVKGEQMGETEYTVVETPVGNHEIQLPLSEVMEVIL